MENNENQFLDRQNEPVISLGDWFITLLICFIPFVNIIMLLIWAFGGGTNPNKANFAKAALIFVLIWLLIMMIFSGVFVSKMTGILFF